MQNNYVKKSVKLEENYCGGSCSHASVQTDNSNEIPIIFGPSSNGIPTKFQTLYIPVHSYPNNNMSNNPKLYRKFNGLSQMVCEIFFMFLNYLYVIYFYKKKLSISYG